MPNRSDSGLSLKDDPAFHDVTLVCSDGIKTGACRAILASRSTVFKAMFHGNMQEITSNKVILHNINSATLHAVLQFIHTENIDSMATSVMMIDVYHAANFLLLPKLMQLVVEQADHTSDFEVAVPLFNDAVVSLPWIENTKDLWETFLQCFCYNLLTVGCLNGLSENALELLLTKSTKALEFITPEYDLLLCIIEWAWTQNATAPSAAERYAIFNAIGLMPAKPSARILLKNGPSKTSLLKMMKHVDFSLICPHRLKSLTEAVDVLTETLPQYSTFCYYAGKNTKCSTGHPSEWRGIRFQWASRNLTGNFVFSERDTVVELPGESLGTVASVRASAPCSAGLGGLCEWDIVIESTGHFHSPVAVLGLVSESFDRVTFKSRFKGCGIPTAYWKSLVVIQQGDIFTFHLDMRNCTCAVSINGKCYGIAWTNVHCNMNLYPAATLTPNAKYRIKTPVRL